MAEYEKDKFEKAPESPQAADLGVKDIVERKGHATGEAADIYGDLQTAEEYGYVERGYVLRFLKLVSCVFSANLGKD
jgi:amino acid transporter